MGTGASPDANDEVTVHYRGTLLNGQEFDSSLKRGEPISFPLNGVIPGWTEGLQLMKEGGKTTFYILKNSPTAQDLPQEVPSPLLGVDF